jgi:monovalent cation:H+ antiporter-2, CPA2 family
VSGSGSSRDVVGISRSCCTAATTRILGVGIGIDPRALAPALPVAIALAVVTGATKVATGVYAARRDGVARRGQLRAGTALIARAEFSLIIIGLAGTSIHGLAPVAMSYVFVVAVIGPVLARFSGGSVPAPAPQAA